MTGSSAVSRFCWHVLAVIAVSFVALKFLLHIHFDYPGWGFYFDVLVASALLYVVLHVRSGQPLTSPRPSRSSGPPVVRRGPRGRRGAPVVRRGPRPRRRRPSPELRGN